MTTPFALIRILVVEHNEVQRVQVCVLLRELGVKNCVPAADVLEALHLMQNSGQNFDVVLTGHDMPIKDGLDLICLIRRTGIFKHLQVAMISEALTDETPTPRAETVLRQFLKRKGVVAVPKKDLSASLLARTLRKLTTI